MFVAISYTLAVKLFHSSRYDLGGEYLGWVLADIACLLGIEVVLSLLCFGWPRKWIVRSVTIIAAVMCTWSIINAAWLIRTGTQFLPRVFLSLFRAPVSSFCIIGVNLKEMPVSAVLILAPSAVALAFFISCLVRPKLPLYNRERFTVRIVVCVIIVITAVAVRPAVARRGSAQIGSVGLRYNAQLRAVMSLVVPDYRQPTDPKRRIPAFDQLEITLGPQQARHNVV
ncbi:MAG: hypothetical protein ACYSYM_05495, partial [Planctomycetota bacterium]